MYLYIKLKTEKSHKVCIKFDLRIRINVGINSLIIKNDTRVNCLINYISFLVLHFKRKFLLPLEMKLSESMK